MIVTEIHFAQGIAFVTITLVALVWASLWRHRSAAVHLWCIAGLMGSAFLAVAVWRSMSQNGSPLVQYPLLATLGIGSFMLKAIALRRLDGMGPPGSWIAGALGAVAVLSFVAAGMELKPSLFTRTIVIVMNAGTLVLAYLSHRLAKQRKLLNARLLSLAIAGPGLISLLSVVAVALTQDADTLLLRDEPMSQVSMAFSLVVAICNNGLFIGVVMDISARREAEALAEVANLQAERRRLEERSQLMADLHDGFGAQLNIASLRAEQDRLTTDQMREILQACVMDLYLVVDTANRTEGGIGNALRYLRHRLGGRLSAGQPVLHWDLDVDDAPPLQPSAVLQVVRIVQEALNNALKHAQAQNIHVFASHDARTQHLHVSVLDDGIGLPLQRVEGNGLKNLRSRAVKLGAALQVRSATPGTLVELSLPTS